MRKFLASIAISTLIPILLLLTLNALGKDASKTISKVDVTKKNMEELIKELEKIQKENGGYPTSDVWIKKVDGWGNNYRYYSDGKTYHLSSFGADNKEGGEAMDADLAVGN